MKQANEPKDPTSQMAGGEPKQAAPNTGGQQQDPKSSPKSSPSGRNAPKDTSSPSHGKDKEPANKPSQSNKDPRS